MIVKNLMLCLIVASSSGCLYTRGYEGSVPDGVLAATVRGEGVTVNSANGRSVSMFSHFVKILPGKNELQVTGDAANFNAIDSIPPTYIIQFDAEPGENYVVTGIRGYGKVCAYKINPQTGDPETHRSVGCVVKQTGGAF